MDKKSNSQTKNTILQEMENKKSINSSFTGNERVDNKMLWKTIIDAIKTGKKRKKKSHLKTEKRIKPRKNYQQVIHRL
ncbi:MAG: hypothetical protein IJB48_02325 [Clostridia bacterium]|nr:hypothetical protein [Clostridia bacterium]